MIRGFEIGTTNEIAYLDVQWYRNSNQQRNCLLTL